VQTNKPEYDMIMLR